MNCIEFTDLISSYIEDDLSDETKNAFEAHLTICRECKEELENVKQLLLTLSTIDEEELPEGFESELHARLEKESKAIKRTEEVRFKIKTISKRGIGIAATFAIGILTIFFVNNGMLISNKAEKALISTSSNTRSIENRVNTDVSKNNLEDQKVTAFDAIQEKTESTEQKADLEIAATYKDEVPAEIEGKLRSAPESNAETAQVPEISSLRRSQASLMAIDQYGNDCIIPNDIITVTVKDVKIAKTKIVSKVTELKGTLVENEKEDPNLRTEALNITLESGNKIKLIDFLKVQFGEENVYNAEQKISDKTGTDTMYITIEES